MEPDDDKERLMARAKALLDRDAFDASCAAEYVYCPLVIRLAMRIVVLTETLERMKAARKT